MHAWQTVFTLTLTAGFIAFLYFFFKRPHETRPQLSKREKESMEKVVMGLFGLLGEHWAIKKTQDSKSPEEKAFFLKLAEGSRSITRAAVSGLKNQGDSDAWSEEYSNDPANWWKKADDTDDQEPPPNPRWKWN